MNESTHSLQVLLEREESERDAALAALQQLCNQLAAARQQNEQLIAYRSDYQRRWNTQFSQGGAIELVHCYQGFMTRLDLAIGQQDRVVQQMQSKLEAARAALAEKEVRVASVRKIIERRTRELQRVTERREQKQTDEAALRAAHRGTLASLSPLALDA